ncbi:MMPL family transporter, partial [Streptomyces canarius]
MVSGPVRAAVAAHTPAGTSAHVGGTAAVFADISVAVDHDLAVVFPVAAALIALILLLLLRSLLAPVVLNALVGLGFAATLGAATLLFQHVLDEPGVSFTLPWCCSCSSSRWAPLHLDHRPDPRGDAPPRSAPPLPRLLRHHARRRHRRPGPGRLLRHPRHHPRQRTDRLRADARHPPLRRRPLA